MARSVFDPNAPAPAAGDPARPAAAKRKPIIKGGATSEKYIRAATQGGADRTYQEIPVDEIAESRIRDRIDITEDLDSLVESLRTNGQQIPILVRIVQGGPCPYEIVVGRRRLAATRQLGLPRIKAFVTRMDNREAFVAQGIENSARLETSYIERARAATQGVREGFEQKDVAEFLNISPTLVNFMVSTYLAVGEDLVQAIGPARGVGRRNWEKLGLLVNKGEMDNYKAVALVDRSEPDSVARFHQTLAAVQAALSRKTPTTEPAVPQATDYLGGRITVERKTRSLTVKGGRDMPPALLDHIDAEVRRILSEHED